MCIDFARRRAEGPDRHRQVGRGLVLRVLATGGAVRRLWRKRGPGWRDGRFNDAAVAAAGAVRGANDTRAGLAGAPRGRVRLGPGREGSKRSLILCSVPCLLFINKKGFIFIFLKIYPCRLSE